MSRGSAVRVARAAWGLPTRIACVDTSVAARLSPRADFAATSRGGVAQARNGGDVIRRSRANEPRKVRPIRELDERPIHLCNDGDGAFDVRSMYARADAPPLLNGDRRWMSVGVSCANRNDGHFRARCLHPFRASSVPAAVVRHFHDVHAWDRLVRQPVLKFTRIRIAGKQRADLVRGFEKK